MTGRTILVTGAISKQKTLPLNHNGEMRRDFTYIDDIVDGVLRALGRRAAGTPPHKLYNLGIPKFIDWRPDFYGA